MKTEAQKVAKRLANKRYDERNKDKVAEYHRKYREKNKIKLRQKAKDFRKSDKGEIYKEYILFYNLLLHCLYPKKYKKYWKDVSKKYRETLHNSYIKSVLTVNLKKKGLYIDYKEIPDILIESQRKSLLLKRKLNGKKENKKSI